MEQQLINYVEQESKRGVPEYMVKKALREAGWDDQLINEAFTEVQSRISPPFPQSKAMPKNNDILDIDDDLASPEGKKKKRALLPAVLIFGALVAIVGSLIAYFIFLAPSEEVVDNNLDGSVVLRKVVKNATSSPEEAAEEPPAAVGEVMENATSSPEEAAEEPLESVTENISVAPNPAVPDNAAATSTSSIDTAQERDERRKSDMQQLANAQKSWYGANSRYYTCGLKSGDCGGMPRSYPARIPNYLLELPQDPLGGKSGTCGKNYVYCGLANAPYPQYYCYYAKLESGGYYSVTPAGSFMIVNEPKTFKECNGK